MIATIADAKTTAKLKADGAKAGDAFDMEIGGLVDESAGAPVRIRGTILNAVEGHGQFWVVVKFGRDNVLILSTYLVQMMEPFSLATLGLDIRTFKVFAIKSRVHFRKGFDDNAFAKTILLVEPDQPYLRPVSDRIPGTDRFYCDSSPRFRWTSNFTGESLRTVLEKYLSAYTNAPKGSLGRVTGVYEQGRTESDRVAALRIETDRGSYLLRGNDIRFVLRSANGEILNSTYFNAEATITSGEVSGLTLRGGGYGHGIGMCQWGAIGRARAGQDYKTILSTYYPGTTIGRMR